MNGGISLSDNEDQYFENTSFWDVLPDQPEFLVIFHKLFQLRQTHRIRNASVLLAIFGKEITVMIIKHHT